MESQLNFLKLLFQFIVNWKGKKKKTHAEGERTVVDAVACHQFTSLLLCLSDAFTNKICTIDDGKQEKKTFYFKMSLSVINADTHESKRARECAPFHFSCFSLFVIFKSILTMFYLFLFLLLHYYVNKCMCNRFFFSIKLCNRLYTLFVKWFFGWIYCLLHFCLFVWFPSFKYYKWLER